MPAHRRIPIGLLLLGLALVVGASWTEIGVQALALRSWTSELGNPGFQERMARIQRLSVTLDRSEVPWLVEVIYHDPSWKPRKEAEIVLAAIEGEGSTPVLVDLLLHAPLWRDRVKPAELLGKYGDRSCAPALIEGLHDYDFLVRYWCAKSLGALREPSAVPHLLRTMEEDPKTYPRMGAAFALGEIGDPSAAAELVRATRDPEPDVRAHAVQALGKLAVPMSAPVVMTLARDPDEEVRKQVCRALGRLRDPRSRATLEALRQDPALQVKYLAGRALERLEGAPDPGRRPVSLPPRQVEDR